MSLSKLRTGTRTATRDGVKYVQVMAVNPNDLTSYCWHVNHDGKGDRVCRFRWCRGRRGRRCERADAVGSDRLQKRKGDREKEPFFPGRKGDWHG